MTVGGNCLSCFGLFLPLISSLKAVGPVKLVIATNLESDLHLLLGEDANPEIPVSRKEQELVP